MLHPSHLTAGHARFRQEEAETARPVPLATETSSESRPAPDSLAAQLERLPQPVAAAADRLDPRFLRRAEQEAAQARRQRAQVEVILARLLAGDGIVRFQAGNPTGPHHCFRHREGLLEVRPHAVFLANLLRARTEFPDETGFRIFLHGRGVMAQRNGYWVENLDPAFFQALDRACRSAGSSFVL